MTLEKSRVASLVDVSTIGAKVHGCGEVEVDSDLWLKVGGIDMLATVVWTADDLCGIAFDQPLSDAQLNQLSPEGEWTMVASLTPEERLAAEDWINDFVR